MHPILFTIPLFGRHLEIPTYGVLLAVAFLGILKISAVMARREKISARDMVDLAFTVFLAGLVGAKLMLVLLDWRYYLANPASLTGVLRSAGVFYGGLIAAIPTAIWFAHRRKLPLWKVADITAVCIPIGMAVGRLGCFSAGCCYGKPSSLPWAVTFTSEIAHQTTGVPLGIPMHPAQLYMSLNGLFMALILFALQGRKTFDGQVFFSFVILYGATRSFWELFRGDSIRGFLIPGVISTSQTIGIVSVAAGLFFLFWRKRQAAREQASS
jgi:phosphatidylglycerol:prolipoprotein diacylglycerol transferase